MVGPTNLKPYASSSFDILIESGRGRGTGGGLEIVDLRGAVDEIPQEFREAGAVFHDLQVGFGAVDRALDLGAIADDAGIVHQRLNFFGRVARDLLRLKIVERLSEILALAQDRDPRQSGLETVEH